MSLCISNLYPVSKDMWIGQDTTGIAHQFKGLDQYREYVTKLTAAGTVCPEASLPSAPAIIPQERTPFTGFLEFKPTDVQQQAKYSAMSPWWVGSETTDTAFGQGLSKSLSR
uniref:Uncharacterized protein n=1 Tax=viral metagenome TaxID=1070528 RepID=A0A6C0CK32_9ZZZZ